MSQLTLLEEMEIIALPGGGELQFWPHFMDSDTADELLEILHKQIIWVQNTIVIAGRKCPIPRLNAWLGDYGAEYGYSGVRLSRQSWIPELVSIRTRLQKLTGTAFNSALLNLYRNNKDSVDWHSDDEPELGFDPVIASLSLGATRRFDLRSTQRAERRHIRLPLSHGSLLLMSPGVQQSWQHRIAKTNYHVPKRINATFRRILHVA